MKHGYVKSETFAGVQLHPGARSITHKIGVSHGSTYVWRGYRTSILRHMIQTQSDTISASSGYTVQVHICNLTKNAGAVVADTVRQKVGGIALGVAGGINGAVDLMNTVLDGISAAQIVGDLAPDMKSPAKLKRPGRAAYMKDHSLNDRIEVRVSAQTGDKHDWTDLGNTNVTVGTVAHLVQAYKP